MDKKELELPIDQNFLQSVSSVLEQAQKNAKTAVNLSMVYAYYEIGRMIVEEEQHGENRAAYGRQLLQELSAYLTKQFGKGFSVGNLKNIRQFYKVYSKDQIGETVFSQFENLPAVSTDKDKVYRLATEGHKVEAAKDAVKDPYVLEFLGLPELPEYSESELESRLIDHLQQFLLELETGFAEQRRTQKAA